MDYYIYTLVSYFILMQIMKITFAEIEGRQARKLSNARYFSRFEGSFVYRKQPSIYFITCICYIIIATEPIFSMLWFAQLIGFIATGVIADGISQVLYHFYVKMRFGKSISEYKQLKEEVEEAFKNQDEHLMQQSVPTYDSHEIISQYFKDDSHLAVVSVDGGDFTSKFEKLPPITYAVEMNSSKAKELLEPRGIKVTTLTTQGKMPFKDEKIDIAVNELSNYDKFEMYRILKPGGYLVVDQLGSDNYKEIMRMFMPFRLKGEWNKDACITTLSDIGFDIIDSFEDVGSLRFQTLPALVAFIKSISPERVEKYEAFMNFYVDALRKIKENHFFELTTHRFMVIARKKEL